MKFIIPVITLLLGLAAGWHLAESQPTNSVDLSEEELSDLMDEIHTLASQAVSESDHQALWTGINALSYQSMIQEYGPEKALEKAESDLKEFKNRYEEGLQLGDHQKIADALYQQIK
ncbi:hypothetical protein [Rubritalea marina]|uniref:hypothetical protein n=1 Tax=Rubritalea marina TaxID=361055 RepID=UPI0003735670|nr:hypothetical protein [Rubritalea marina]